MKKSVLVLLFLPFFLTSYSQDNYPVIGIVEHFTNTDCPICGNVNPGFHDIREKQDSYLHLSIHPSKPYSSCALYQANKEDNTARTEYYDINGTPTVVFNGTKILSASQVEEGTFSENLDKNSQLAIQVEDFRSESRVEVTVETNGEHPTDEPLIVFVYMVEKTVNYTGNSGESIHYNVMRDIINNNEGTVVEIEKSAGARWAEEFEYSIDSEFDEKEIYFMTYIQGRDSKNIYNAHSTEEDKVLTSVFNKERKPLSVFPNPVSDQLFVSVPQLTPKSRLSIYDQAGNEIKSMDLLNAQVENHSVNMSELSSGVYTIVINSSNKLYTQKVIKL